MRVIFVFFLCLLLFIISFVSLLFHFGDDDIDKKAVLGVIASVISAIINLATFNVPAPQILPSNDIINPGDYVEIQSEASQAIIYYVEDERRDPKDGVVYSSPILVDGPITIRAISKFLWAWSEPVSKHYNVYEVAHQHDTHYYNEGQCDSCGEWLPNQRNNAYVETGTYVVSKQQSAILRLHPYAISGVSNYSTELPHGTNVLVTGAVVNGFGQEWYSVQYADTYGYVHASELEMLPVSTECTHDAQYRTYGLCDICGEWLPNNDDNAPVDLGIYYVSNDDAAYLYTHPYIIPNKSDYLEKMYIGNEVSVIGAVVNGFGKLWYRVLYEGKVGFVVSDVLSPENELILYCSHDSQYFQSGLCGICGEWLPNKNDNVDVRVGVYAVPQGKKAYYRVHPYKISDENIGELLDTLYPGEEAYVTGAVINGLNNRWYEVSYNGQYGYIVSDKLEFLHY